MTHTATLVIDGDHLQVLITCKAPPEARCHSEPTCECEEYSSETLPDGSHGHTIYRDVHEFRRLSSGHDQCKECDELPGHEMHTGEDEVWHPHRQREGYCNYLVWMTEGDEPQTYYDGPRVVPLNDTPIVFTWEGDYYSWRPA